MLKALKGAAVGCAALAIASTVVFAAGYFPGFPIVGSAAYCQGSAVTTNTITVPGTLATPNTCVDNVPAGPSIVTGNELIPADTSIGSNQQPATVYLTLASLNALPPAYPQFSNATSTNTFTVSPNVGVVILSSTAGLLSSTTMTFPAAPIDGQQLAFSSQSTISTFAVSANIGQSSVDNPTVFTASTSGTPQGYRWIYRAATAQWLRLQ